MGWSTASARCRFRASAVTGSGYRPARRRLAARSRSTSVMPALHDPADAAARRSTPTASTPRCSTAIPYLWDAIKQLDDAELRLGCAQAYNDWIAEFCSHDPTRLIGVGRIPTAEIEDARREMRPLRRRPGPEGVRARCLAGRRSGPADPDLDALWEVAARAGCPISLHYGLGDSRSAPTAGIAAGLKPPAADAMLPLASVGRVRPVPDSADGVGARRRRLDLPLDGVPRQHLPTAASPRALQAAQPRRVPERVPASPLLVHRAAGPSRGHQPADVRDRAPDVGEPLPARRRRTGPTTVSRPCGSPRSCRPTTTGDPGRQRGSSVPAPGLRAAAAAALRHRSSGSSTSERTPPTRWVSTTCAPICGATRRWSRPRGGVSSCGLSSRGCAAPAHLVWCAHNVPMTTETAVRALSERAARPPAHGGQRSVHAAPRERPRSPTPVPHAHLSRRPPGRAAAPLRGSPPGEVRRPRRRV